MSRGTCIRVTPREREVLSLMADGMYAREAAEAMGVSPRTVYELIERACNRIGRAGEERATLNRAIALYAGGRIVSEVAGGHHG